MKKKIFAIPVLLLTFALLSIPVLGAPATIKEVTMTAATTPEPDKTWWVSHETIRHAIGTGTGTVTLNIQGQEDPLLGDWYSEWANNGNFKKDPVEIVIRAKVVLTFPGGTFEGVMQRKIIGYPPSSSSIFIDHGVYQGTGVFKGQTLKLSYEGTLPMISEGYLIMPK